MSVTRPTAISRHPPRSAARWTTALVAPLLLGCDGGTPARDAAVADVRIAPATPRLDLLLVIDNSGSMTSNHDRFLASLDVFFDVLAAPLPDGRALRDLHVGVVSTDLGSPSFSLVDCHDRGDDARLNPIAHGATARFGRDPRCSDPSRRDILRSNLATERRGELLFDLRCQLAMAVGGCGIEQSLEAAHRALGRRPSDDAGPFLRDDAVLAVVVLSDEEDASTRDCRNADPEAGACVDARDVFDSASTRWRTDDVNLRHYDYTPCGPYDPHWPIDRYAHPTNPAVGYAALRPGHPERVVFAAITGIPLRDPRAPIEWSSLLGVASPRGVDDFCGRDARGLVWTAPDGTQTSMRPENLDPGCPARVVPACYREGSAPSAGCATTDRYFAWPGRRIVEVARRFDESPRCNGAPCGNGYVASICADDFRPAMTAIAERVRRRL